MPRINMIVNMNNTVDTHTHKHTNTHTHTHTYTRAHTHTHIHKRNFYESLFVLSCVTFHEGSLDVANQGIPET